ncbi:succinylglutamate desuccinylase/aspartoacylase domain-containing protein [Roseibacillus ishigakijimensis]|uniref:Succinylglutamate desuccinylase/aspartoacylase family protein n=1 Tax=Roseibacillus ishigakijimensis TaxID=454146 RepID=A0A934RNM7_9BACT|nr:succinylglutamate desuccinylase/aspartoacylase family protein [Roseibacillus ishigakijimensis]MBK1835117.1 succinylglutamate desuccinylase/aspartoacylase family protein [Roseibacillus ishigakijimensis]
MPLDPQDLLARFRSAAARQDFEFEALLPDLPAFTRLAPGPVVHLSAGIHGDEPASPLAALEFLENGPAADLHWLLTPLMNPSGLARGSRENRDGLDLNRDYLHGQSAEVAAQREWLSRQPVPDLFISLHEDYDATGFYFYEIQLAGNPSVRDAVFTEIKTLLPLEPGPIIDERESSGPGWFFLEEMPDKEEFAREAGGFPEALHLGERGCPLSLTFETPTHAVTLETRIAAHLAAIAAALAEFRKF